MINSDYKSGDFIVVTSNNGDSNLCSQGYEGVNVNSTYRIAYKVYHLYRLVGDRGTTRELTINNIRPATNSEIISFLAAERAELKKIIKSYNNKLKYKNKEILKYKSIEW